MNFRNWLTYYCEDRRGSAGYFENVDRKNIVILHFRNNCVMKIEGILPQESGVVTMDTYISFMNKFTGMTYV